MHGTDPITPNVRLKSVLLILLCSAFSIVTGRWLDQSSGAGTSSYRAIYYGARCLLQHSDPYDPDEFSRIYMTESGALPRDPARRPPFLRAVMVCVNLPTTLFLLIPFALLPWGLSHTLWLVIIATSLTTAALLAYDLTPQSESRLPLVLICLLMANCQVLFTVANTAGVVVGLCVIAVWCFVRQRFEWIGILALAISLALKPHDSGLIWLWLFVSGGVLRRRALQTAVLVAAIALPAALLVAQSSPHWSTELRGNLAATSAHGDISDPGPASSSWKGSADIIIDLQSVLSLFIDDPHFYNPATYLICGSLIVIWLVAAVRRRQSPEITWFALGSLVALSLIVSYHRPYDAKLLLLVIPSFAMVWSRGGRLATIAAVLTTAAIILTSDIPISICTLIAAQIGTSSLASRISTTLITRSAPIALLACSIFFLWFYLSSRQTIDSKCSGSTVC